MAALVNALVGAAVALGVREAMARLSSSRRASSPADNREPRGAAAEPAQPKTAGMNGSSSSGNVQQPAAEPSWLLARHVSPPHPAWRPGMPQPCPFPGAGDYHSIDPATYPVSEMYPLVISAAVPRPVAFISTVDAAGVVNLSPYSYFNAMGHNPPTVAIGLCANKSRPEGKKDTQRNIEATGEFVVNIISEWFVEAANHTCGDYPPGVDEMALAGLTPLPSTKVRPPRVAESAVQLECRLRTMHVVNDSSGTPTTAIAIGEVVHMHVSHAVEGRSPSGKLVVDLVKLAPVARCGGVTYARCTELYDLGRPDSAGNYPGQRPA